MQLARNWWTLALRGGLAILFGALLLFAPFRTVAAMMSVFGVFVALSGMFTMFAGLRAHEQGAARWWVLLAQGFFGVMAGIVAYFAPLYFAAALVYIVAGWAIITGVLEMVTAVRLRRELENEWMLFVAGAVSLVLGVFLFASPGAGILAGASLIGIYALVSGVLLLVIGLRLRSRALSHRPAVTI